MTLWDVFAAADDDEVDPGTDHMDVSMYPVEGLTDPSDCGGAK